MPEEFDILTKIEDGYSVEDILEILNISVERLLSVYLYEDIMEHLDEFDI